MMKLNERQRGWILFIALAVLVYFPVFMHLGYLPFRIWDESVLGVNALQMARNHDYIVTYFYSYPDMYRCKPPLMVWLIVGFTKLLGFSEFTIRLPSALAAAALCLYLFFKLGKITGSRLFGFFAVLVLVSSSGYIGFHITRTGEYESLWLLCSTVFSFSLFTAVETDSEPARRRALFLFFVFVSLGMLTKGIVCFLYFIPGFAIYILWRGKGGALLRSSGFYAGLALFIILVPGYYLLREHLTPGYWHAVCANEMSTHFKSVDLELEGPVTRRYPVIFFLKRLVYTQFTYYIFLLPVSLYAGLRWPVQGIRKVVQFAAISGFTYLFVISLAGKKVPHYSSPAIICFSIITGALLYAGFNRLRQVLNNKGMEPQSSGAMAFACMLLLAAWPYYQIMRSVYCPEDVWEGSFSATCRIFQQAERGAFRLDNYKLILDTTPIYGPAMVLSCYRQELAEKGQTLHFALPGNLQVNDQVIVFDSTSLEQVESRYQIRPLAHLDYCHADILAICSAR